MIEIANWEWPQYILIMWWVCWTIVALMFLFTGEGPYKNKTGSEMAGIFLGRRISVIGMFIVLMFGGFWA